MPYYARQRRRNTYNQRNYARNYGRGQQNNDTFDGFYDRDGNPLDVVIQQTASDMMVPRYPSAERDDGNWAVNRSGWRHRY